MNKVSETKRVFRLIDESLDQMKMAPRGEVVKIAESLQKLNEEMCDKFVEIIKEREKYEALRTN